MKIKCIAVVLLLSLFSCQKDDDTSSVSTQDILKIPRHFPSIDFPSDNPFTVKKWELGKSLFYDTRLSKDGNISCASCHKSQLAFSDDVPTSEGVLNLIGSRNAPTLANVAYLPYYTREGGVPSLEMQILVPIQEHNEFGHNIIDIVNELKEDIVLNQMSMDAYERPIDAFVLTRSIATFERSLISGNSNYDKDNLTAIQSRGKDLFFSDRTNCSTCHGGFNFTNNAIDNNGLYDEYIDVGRYRLTGLETDIAKFKVPTLRNIALTAPYMHDGSLSNLEAVIEHYSTGIKDHPNKNKVLQPLNLTTTEKDELKAFLISLTDHDFVNNELFKLK